MLFSRPKLWPKGFNPLNALPEKVLDSIDKRARKALLQAINNPEAFSAAKDKAFVSHKQISEFCAGALPSCHAHLGTNAACVATPEHQHLTLSACFCRGAAHRGHALDRAQDPGCQAHQRGC